MSLRYFYVIAAIIFAVFLIRTSAFAVIEREITIKPSAEVWAQEVCLQDIVEDGWIRGRCAVDKKQCCRWNLENQISKVFTRSEILSEIAKINFGGITLKPVGADRTEITQTRRELKNTEIQALLIDAIATKISSGDPAQFEEIKTRTTISSLRVPMAIFIPLDAEKDWSVSIPDTLKNPLNIRVFSMKDQSTTLGWVQASAAHFAPIYVAKKTIRPTDKINIDDFELKNSDVLSADESAFRKGNFPEGVRARQTILAGKPLSVPLLEKLPIVQLGDAVTLILKSDNLRISTKGVAQSAAGVGDILTVQLQRYNRTFKGKLQEGKTVEVAF